MAQRPAMTLRCSLRGRGAEPQPSWLVLFVMMAAGVSLLAGVALHVAEPDQVGYAIPVVSLAVLTGLPYLWNALDPSLSRRYRVSFFADRMEVAAGPSLPRTIRYDHITEVVAGGPVLVLRLLGGHEWILGLPRLHAEDVLDYLQEHGSVAVRSAS